MRHYVWNSLIPGTRIYTTQGEHLHLLKSLSGSQSCQVPPFEDLQLTNAFPRTPSYSHACFYSHIPNKIWRRLRQHPGTVHQNMQALSPGVVLIVLCLCGAGLQNRSCRALALCMLQLLGFKDRNMKNLRPNKSFLFCTITWNNGVCFNQPRVKYVLFGTEIHKLPGFTSCTLLPSRVLLYYIPGNSTAIRSLVSFPPSHYTPNIFPGLLHLLSQCSQSPQLLH